MRIVNIITLLLVIIGGINWLLVGLANTDLVASLFGGQDSTFSVVLYVLVGLSAIWQLGPLFRAMSADQTAAEANSIRH